MQENPSKSKSTLCLDTCSLPLLCESPQSHLDKDGEANPQVTRMTANGPGHKLRPTWTQPGLEEIAGFNPAGRGNAKIWPDWARSGPRARRCCWWPCPGRMRRTRAFAFPDPIPVLRATLTRGPDARPQSPSGHWSHGSAPRGHRRGSGSLSCPRPTPAQSLRTGSSANTVPGAPAPGRWAAQTS